MEYTINPVGVCSMQINVKIEEDIIKDVKFIGGCAGNTMGISSLLIGMKVEDVIVSEKAKEMSNPTDSLFWGVPFVMKDNFSTKDIPTSSSSNILNGYIPLYDSTVYKKLLDLRIIPNYAHI
mgnify:CR=1 FL=1